MEHIYKILFWLTGFRDGISILRLGLCCVAKKKLA